jgi:hypothetical protein
MPKIRTNVVGKVSNMQLTRENGKMALYEAIVNSLQSIDSARRSDQTLQGKILIEIRRNPLGEPDDNGLLPVTDIIIEDNGVGFNPRNYISFQTAESTYKFKIGGKGIGRFLWLKVFDRAEIRSVYKDLRDHQYYRRSFAFVLDNKNPIVDEHLAPLVNGEAQPSGSRVKLCKLQGEYAEPFSGPAEELADAIIEHHIQYLVDDNCPEIILRDDRAGLTSSVEFNLNLRFRQEFLLDAEADSVALGGYTFPLVFLKIKNDSLKQRHAILYSANKRVVLSHALSQLIPNLLQPLQIEDGLLFDVLVIVSGSYLDQHVNGERTKLDIPLKKTTTRLGKPIVSLSDIEDAVVAQTYSQFEEYLVAIREAKQVHMQSYVNNKAPQYRTLMNYPHLLDKIKPNLKDDQLDIELHKVRNELVIESRISLSKILDASSTPAANTPEFDNALTQLVNKISDVSQSNLVDYVVHRKMILRLFDSVLERRSDDTYEYEKQVHNIIFPMQKTSDEILYDDHNLWLIDERLSYHRFLQSDKPLNPEDKSSRPDILLSFDKALLYTDSKKAPYEAFTIIEFKRPMRENYGSGDDPVRQVYNYIEEINEGKARTKEGRPIIPSKSCKFYCYIICDITPPIHRFARQNSLSPSPDDLGYFGFNPNYNAYTEIISFDKLVEDSKQRNQILFDKLGINHV